MTEQKETPAEASAPALSVVAGWASWLRAKIECAYWVWRLKCRLKSGGMDWLHGALLRQGYTWEQDFSTGTITYRKDGSIWTITNVWPNAGDVARPGDGATPKEKTL